MAWTSPATFASSTRGYAMPATSGKSLRVWPHLPMRGGISFQATHLPIAGDQRSGADRYLSNVTSSPVYLSVAVAIVLVVVLPVVVPFPVRVLEMTPVPIGIANPTTLTAIDRVLAIFRLAPTPVSVVVAANPYAMIAVRVTALVGMSKRY